MATKFVSCCMGRAHRVPFFVGCAASVLLALRTLVSGAGSAATESLAGNNLGASNLATTGATSSPAPEKGGEVNVKTYGAVGDGVTNDTAAFNAALKSVAEAGGGVCLVPKGTYIISASGVTAPFIPAVSSGVHLVGQGRGESILKVNGMPTNHLLQCDGDNWSVENLTFDMQDYFPRRNVSAITCKGANWRVANCAVNNIGRFGISAFGGDHWSIERNYFTKTVPVGRANESINVSVNKTGTIYATNARIIDNVCEGSGILFWGNHSIIAHNRVSRAGFGTGIGTGQSARAYAVEVTDNICTGGRGFDVNRTWVSGFELWAPNSLIANNIAYDNDGSGIHVGGQNCIVIGNHSYNNGVHPARSGFDARYANPVDNASGSIFIGNLGNDTRYPGSSATQTYGYSEQPGGLHDIMHIQNDYNGNKIGPTKYNSVGGHPNVSEAQGSRVIQARLSPEMKTRLKALAKDADTPDAARRALHDISADR